MTENCDVCGFPPKRGNVIYESSGRRPLCRSCNGIKTLRQERDEQRDAKEAAYQQIYALKTKITMLVAALKEIARSPQVNCAQDHDPPGKGYGACDCAGDMVRAALVAAEERHKEPGGNLPRHVVRGPCWCIEGNHGG